ncbi:MAG: hypothetical protein Q7R93_04030 [bacterium]|nr:hypothetical protein [bacterium]
MAFEAPQSEQEPDKQAILAEILDLQEKIAAKQASMAELKGQVDAQMEEKYKEGELVRPVEPTQPGWEGNKDIRKALRNMRDTAEAKLWVRYHRGVFQKELFAQTIMQGVHSDLKKDDEIDSGFKEDMRVMKRRYVMYSGDLTFGFDPNVTKKLHLSRATELDKLRRLANDELTKFGPEEFFKYYDGFNKGIDEYDKNIKHENIGKRYQDLIDAHNAGLSADSPDRITEKSLGNQERYDVRYQAGLAVYDQVSQNLADDEFTLMPGMLRGLYVVMRNMEEGPLGYYNKRDLDVKIPMVEFFIKQFRDDILGRGKMTKRNALLFPWFANKAGQNFIPFENIDPDLKNWYEIIKSLVGRPDDARAAASTYPKVKNTPGPVMREINRLRAEESVRRAGKGKPPLEELTPETQPFAKFGVAS